MEPSGWGTARWTADRNTWHPVTSVSAKKKKKKMWKLLYLAFTATQRTRQEIKSIPTLLSECLSPVRDVACCFTDVSEQAFVWGRKGVKSTDQSGSFFWEGIKIGQSSSFKLSPNFFSLAAATERELTLVVCALRSLVRLCSVTHSPTSSWKC